VVFALDFRLWPGSRRSFGLCKAWSKALHVPHTTRDWDWATRPPVRRTFCKNREC